MKFSLPEMREKKVLIQEIIDRMKEVVGVTKDVELAEALGASRSSTAVWKIRERVPYSECMTLAQQYGVNLDWLLLGRGTAGIEEPELELHPGNVPNSPDQYVEFPAFDMPSFIENEVAQQSMRMPRTWIEGEGVSIDDTIAMRVTGNCMTPTVCDGDVLLVDRRPRDIDGVYLVRVGESLRIRRVQRVFGGSLHLLCDNKTYATDVIPADQADAVDFIGYCFAHFRRVR
jgi:phage repressor protein C with HTH and peptisase S24 domain